MTLALGGESMSNALEISKQWRDTPTVTATLEALHTKAAVASGTQDSFNL